MMCVLVVFHVYKKALHIICRYRRDLFEKGHVFVAVPPLYKVELSSAAAALMAPSSPSTSAEDPNLEGESSNRVGNNVSGEAGASKYTSGKSVVDKTAPRTTLWCYSEAEMREAVKGLPSGSFAMQV